MLQNVGPSQYLSQKRMVADLHRQLDIGVKSLFLQDHISTRTVGRQDQILSGTDFTLKGY